MNTVNWVLSAVLPLAAMASTGVPSGMASHAPLLLSATASTRATAYPMSSKLVTRDGRRSSAAW